jgi:hypothetical protein
MISFNDMPCLFNSISNMKTVKKKKKLFTIAYSDKETNTITKLLKNTNINTYFITNNTAGKLLQPKP